MSAGIYGGYTLPESDFMQTTVFANVWRWGGSVKAGMYHADINVGPLFGFILRADCVVDDFGNLVRVP